MNPPLHRKELFEAAHRWQAGDRPVSSHRSTPIVAAKQTLNPFPRMDLIGDFALNLMTFGLWSFYMLHRLLHTLRREDPTFKLHSPVASLIGLFTCGLYGFVLQLQLAQRIEDMRVKHGLPAHRTWGGYIAGFLFALSPPVWLWLLQLRISQSSTDWERKNRLPSQREQQPQLPWRVLKKCLWGIAFLVVMVQLALSTENRPETEMHQGGKPVTGAMAIDDEQFLTWSPTHDTMQIRTWDDGIQSSFPIPTKGEPNQVRLHPNGELVVLGPKNELVITKKPLNRNPTWTAIPIDSAVDFEILSDEQLLTWGKAGRVTLIDVNTGKQRQLLGLSGRVMGAMQLRNDHILAWTHAGDLHCWDTSGDTQWTHHHEGGTIRQVAESDARWLLVAPRDDAPFFLQPESREVQSINSQASVPLAYSVHDLGELGFVAVYRSGEMEGFSPTGENLGHSQWIQGPILGTQMVDAPQGGLRELVIWNRANEMVLFQRTEDSISLMNQDSNNHSHRILGVIDRGEGTILAWDRTGELKQWEF